MAQSRMAVWRMRLPANPQRFDASLALPVTADSSQLDHRRLCCGSLAVPKYTF